MTLKPRQNSATPSPNARKTARLATVHGKRHGSWRTRLVVVLVGCVWSVLAVRLIHLQWFARAELAELASRQRSLAEIIPARPGDILDRHGRLLATSVSAKSLFIAPNRISDPWPVAVAVSEVLSINAEALFQRITANDDKHFLWVQRRLDDEAAERIRRLSLPAGVWGFRDEYLRRYPQGSLAAHVIGLRDIDGRGRGGVEESQDAKLAGRQGRRELSRDAHGRVVAVHESVVEAPRHGATVKLTLDAVVQLYTERVLDRVMEQWKPRGAAAIVLDIQASDVLAMCSRPTFDPNRPAQAADAAWKNRAVSWMYEPGSTFKPMIVAWALQQQVVRTDEMFDCESGSYQMGRRILHDDRPLGTLTLSDVLVRSSNIGMAKIGERLTNAELYKAVIAFGFGGKTGVGLPAELTGTVRPLAKWDSYSTGSVPMGQEIAVTPLQVLTAHAALANGGKLVAPRIVLNTDHPIENVPADSYLVAQTVDHAIAKWIVENPLTEVVRSGTGRKARLPDYSVFGKTGTAQTVDPATGRYSDRHHVCSFVCGAPAADPRVLVLVVVDQPTVGQTHHGGTVAAPPAAEILVRTLVHMRVPIDFPSGQTAEHPHRGEAAK